MMFARTCIVIFLFLAVSKVEAGVFFRTNDYYYEILGTTSDQGMNDAIVALRLGNINLIAHFAYSVSIPVWARNHEQEELSQIMPRFYSCFPFPVIEILEPDMYASIPSTERHYPLQHALGSYESVSHVPDDAVVNTLCTYDYARGYNTVVLNYLILHPANLDKMRQTPEQIKEKRLRNAQDMREAMEEAMKYLQEIDALPSDCPSITDDTDASQEKHKLEGAVDDERPEIDIGSYSPMKELGQAIPIDPDSPPGEKCDIPLVLEDIDLLPLADFLKENGF